MQASLPIVDYSIFEGAMWYLSKNEGIYSAPPLTHSLDKVSQVKSPLKVGGHKNIADQTEKTQAPGSSGFA